MSGAHVHDFGVTHIAPIWFALIGVNAWVQPAKIGHRAMNDKAVLLVALASFCKILEALAHLGGDTINAGFLGDAVARLEFATEWRDVRWAIRINVEIGIASGWIHSDNVIARLTWADSCMTPSAGISPAPTKSIGSPVGVASIHGLSAWD
jgi:hypothetical protein